MIQIGTQEITFEQLALAGGAAGQATPPTEVEWLAADALADGFSESDLPIGRIDGTSAPSLCPSLTTPVARS